MVLVRYRVWDGVSPDPKPNHTPKSYPNSDPNLKLILLLIRIHHGTWSRFFIKNSSEVFGR